MEPLKPTIKAECGDRQTSTEFRLPLTRCVFRAIARDRIQPQFFIANGLRGGLGYVLKELVCTFDTGDCVACSESSRCVYTTTFDTRFALEGRTRGSLASPPPPYALRCDTLSSSLEVGQEFEFILSLFGRATLALPNHLAALLELGERGLGPSRARYRVTKITALGPCSESNVVFENGSQVTYPDAWCLGSSRRRPDRAARAVRLRLVSPARVKTKGGLWRAPFPFALVIRQISRRIRLLERFYTDSERLPPFPLPAHDAVQIRASALEWKELKRYSTRQRSSMPIGGLIGEIVYEGDVAPHLDLLHAGSLVQLGKGAGFGLGAYDVEVVD